MKKTFILSAFATIVMVACGQTPEERVKAYEARHEEMMKEYRQTMDSLSADREKADKVISELLPKSNEKWHR